MPIISQIQRRTLNGKLLLAGIFALLSVGGLTMIYPFALMLSGALRSEMDQADMDLIPAYLYQPTALYQKYLETKYNQDAGALNRAHGSEIFSFRDVRQPRENGIAATDLREFLAEGLPEHWQVLGGTHGVRTVPENLRVIRRQLARNYDDDLNALGRDMGAPLESWNAILVSAPQWLSQRYNLQEGPVTEAYRDLFRRADLAERQLVSLSGHFLETIVYPIYGRMDPAILNRAFGLNLERLGDFRLPPRLPEDGTDEFRQGWIAFVRESLNPSFVLLPPETRSEFIQHLRQRYESIDSLNQAWKSKYATFERIPLPGGEWLGGARRVDYLEFVQARPVEEYRLVGPEFAWSDWLAKTYEDADDLNAAYGSAWDSLNDVPFPLPEMELEYVQANSASLKTAYALRNFINVFDELFVQGRIFFNTVILCGLAVFSALLINPLAAYAMSRFRLPGTYKILLFLMATMAFPPIITLIPTFIILRNFDLLNTFAALVLPTVANGYLIFLLKGFFDSLPRELYEAATIDGASELRIFFQITMALSKPILAVVALQAFNSAYLMFLYALVVAPDPDMWIINVWIYQWQKTASMGAVMASVLVASIPTLVIFLFAQNIIMRGIVVPVEK